MEIGLENLTGRQKAAIFLISLGPDKAASILKKLREDEIEVLTEEISKWDNIPPDFSKKVYEEFYQMSSAAQYINQGGKKYAQETLRRALGDHKAIEIINRLRDTSESSPFNILKSITPEQLFELIQSEHPQTIALILSHLNPEQAANVLSSFSEELRSEIISRIISIEQISPEVTRQIENVLRKNLISASFKERFQAVGGVEAAAEILNHVNRSTEKGILEALKKQSPSLAEEIKKLMFVFDDIPLVEDRSLQRALREIDTKDLALALKGADNEIKEKFFKNMSSRAVETIKEDIEFMGPVRLRDVEAVQQKIVEVIRKLEEKGEVIITGRGGKEEEIIV